MLWITIWCLWWIDFTLLDLHMRYWHIFLLCLQEKKFHLRSESRQLRQKKSASPSETTPSRWAAAGEGAGRGTKCTSKTQTLLQTCHLFCCPYLGQHKDETFFFSSPLLIQRMQLFQNVHLVLDNIFMLPFGCNMILTTTCVVVLPCFHARKYHKCSETRFKPIHFSSTIFSVHEEDCLYFYFQCYFIASAESACSYSFSTELKTRAPSLKN